MKKFAIGFGLLLITGCAVQRVDYRPLLVKVNETTYPNANAVYVFDSTHINVEPTGQYISKSHKLIKILSDQGINEFAKATFGYMKSYGTLRVKYAFVITPQGERKKVPKESIKDMPLPAFEGSKAFIPNVRLVTITFPGLEKGSSIEYEVDEHMITPPVKDNFDFYDLFEGNEPIREKQVFIDIPEAMKLSYLVDNGNINFEKTKKDGKVEYHWWREDVKGIVDEPGMPPTSDIATKLLATTMKSWKEWSRWYYELCKPDIYTDSTLNVLIDSLIAGGRTREDSIKALFYFVSRKIRYVETTLTGKRAGYEPAPAPQIFKRGYGVCRDKAALLVAMLRKIGIDAHIVLTNPVIHIEEKIPVDQFNHAIVAIKTKSGYRYLDPTAENTKVFLPAYEEGKSVLVCNSEGEDIATIPYTDPSRNSMLFSSDETLSGDTLKGILTVRTKGLFDNQMRNLLEKMSPAMAKTVFQGMVQSVAENAVVDSMVTSNYKDYSVPFSVKLLFHAADYGNFADNSIRLPSRCMKGLSMGIGHGGANLFSLDKRKYPLYLWLVMKIEGKVDMKIPEGYKVSSLPPPKKLEDAYFMWSASYKNQGDSLLAESAVAIKNPLIPPGAYKELKRMMKEIEDYAKEEIILTKEAR